MQYKTNSDWSIYKISQKSVRRVYSQSSSHKMAARILSRVNLVSKRFFAAAASPGASVAERELAEAKHAACKSIDSILPCYCLQNRY